MSSTALKMEKVSSNRPGPLHRYQLNAGGWLVDTDRALLAFDPGMGKTATALLAVDCLMDRGAVKRVLIIAPKRVAVHTWPTEIDKWCPEYTYQVMDGGPQQRAQMLHDPAPIQIIGRDLVPWLVDQKTWNEWPWDMVIIDESSGFKSPSSKRFKQLAKVIHHSKRVVLLSGTPACESLMDLWSQVFLIDGGERLGKPFSKFRAMHYESDYMGWSWTPRPGAEDKIRAAVEDIIWRASSEDYLSLPDRVDQTLTVDLPPEARRAYHEAEKEFLVTLDDATLPVTNAAVLANKLLQIANGGLYDEDKVHHLLHREKAQALADLADDTDDNLLVAYSYQSDIAAIKRVLGDRATHVDEPDAIRRWNEGHVKCLIAHPMSAGHGLNLQAGGNRVVWYGLPWSLELYLQFNARLHRQGQERPVFVHHILAADTVDETVMAALEAKDTSQRTLLEHMRRATEERVR